MVVEIARSKAGMDAKFVGACPGDEAGSLKVRATRADGDGNDRAVQEEPLTSLHAKHKQVGLQ